MASDTMKDEATKDD